MSNKFWTGVALGALTVGAGIGLAYATSSRPCCTYRNTCFGGFTGFGYGLGYGFGFNNGFTNYGFNGFCNRHIVYGPTPFESFGVSNRVMSQLNLGWYV